ncbi:hypothetical protein SAMN06265222_101620 [Neorhodopirellula lusitana]|uniref:Uncharacterized protein n=1 Tax=Neorhodopirellula lusitana TaxID=445327 RepID=A0ABY1PPQ9_9BACT|nr:hypothetical protein SAMN06265222_101620 [Neorhodopirellula lusitana]
MTPHEGIIYDSCVYTAKSLVMIMGYRQTRSVGTQFEKIGCSVKRIGAKPFLFGYELRIVIEEWHDSGEVPQ